jgi:hypothetical protein
VTETEQKTRILYVNHRSELCGASLSLSYLIRSLDRDRFEPHVFVPDGPAARLFADADALVHIGPVSIFAHAWDNPYAGFRWLVLSREVSKLVPHVRSLDRLVKRYAFSIVHLNDSPLLPAAWVAWRNGAEVVWHLRLALAGEGRDRQSGMITRLIDRWGTAAIAIDQDVAERFRARLCRGAARRRAGFGASRSRRARRPSRAARQESPRSASRALERTRNSGCRGLPSRVRRGRSKPGAGAGTLAPEDNEVQAHARQARSGARAGR